MERDEPALWSESAVARAAGHRFRSIAPSQDSGQSNGDQNGVVNVTTVGATAADALGLNKAFVQALNDSTNNAAKSALLGARTADGTDAQYAS